MCLPKQCDKLVIQDSAYANGNPGDSAVQSYSIIVDGNIVESGNINSASENILFGESENCVEQHVSTLPPTISPTPNPTPEPTTKPKIEPTKIEPE
jgi:hypothetical protein